MVLKVIQLVWYVSTVTSSEVDADLLNTLDDAALADLYDMPNVTEFASFTRGPSAAKIMYGFKLDPQSPIFVSLTKPIFNFSDGDVAVQGWDSGKTVMTSQSSLEKTAEEFASHMGLSGGSFGISAAVETATSNSQSRTYKQDYVTWDSFWTQDYVTFSGWGTSNPSTKSRVTDKGCACKWNWQHASHKCPTACCYLSTAHPQGWCVVEDESCQGNYYGYCQELLMLDDSRAAALDLRAKAYIRTKTPAQIIARMGEFYADSFYTGGILRLAFQKTSTSRSESSSFSQSVEAKVNVIIASASFSEGTSSKDFSSSSSNSESLTVEYRGGNAALWAGGGSYSSIMTAWAQSFNDENAFPVRMKLVPIWQVVSVIDQSKGEAVKAMLEKSWGKDADKLRYLDTLGYKALDGECPNGDKDCPSGVTCVGGKCHVEQCLYDSSSSCTSGPCGCPDGYVRKKYSRQGGGECFNCEMRYWVRIRTTDDDDDDGPVIVYKDGIQIASGDFDEDDMVLFKGYTDLDQLQVQSRSDDGWAGTATYSESGKNGQYKGFRCSKGCGRNTMTDCLAVSGEDDDKQGCANCLNAVRCTLKTWSVTMLATSMTAASGDAGPEVLPAAVRGQLGNHTRVGEQVLLEAVKKTPQRQMPNIPLITLGSVCGAALVSLGLLSSKKNRGPHEESLLA